MKRAEHLSITCLEEIQVVCGVTHTSEYDWEDNSSKIAKIKNILGIYMIFLLEELMLYLDDMNLSVMLSDLS